MYRSSSFFIIGIIRRCCGCSMLKSWSLPWKNNFRQQQQRKKKRRKKYQPIYTFIWITTVRSNCTDPIDIQTVCSIQCSIKHKTLEQFVFFIAPSISTKLIYPIKFDGYLYSQASCTHSFHILPVFRMPFASHCSRWQRMPTKLP